MSRAPVTAIVLAGGRSTRFGSDKMTAVVGGRPLLHRAIDAVAEVSDQFVLVLAPDAPMPVLPDHLAQPMSMARDLVARKGPLAGLVAGLAVAIHPRVLLVAGDQPLLRVAVLGALLDELGDSGHPDAPDVVALEDGDSLWPFPVALRAPTVRPAAVAALAGTDLRLFTLFGRLRVARVPEARWRALDPRGDSLRDVDTPDDIPPTSAGAGILPPTTPPHAEPP